MNRMDREDHLHTAFQYFDKDSSGYITEEDAEPAVKNHGTWLMSRSLSQGPFNIF
jgi:calcium-dependent protein kinase